jgi:hypothetical protein
MSERNYLLISALVFALFSLLHLVRVITHWPIQVGAVAVPFWGSWLVVVIFAVMSVWAFRLMSEWRQSHP